MFFREISICLRRAEGNSRNCVDFYGCKYGNCVQGLYRDAETSDRKADPSEGNTNTYVSLLWIGVNIPKVSQGGMS
jgi:hypothetical protein